MAHPSAYFDYDLRAKVPVKRYKADFSSVVDTVLAGSIVGKIFSYKTDSHNNVWWMLYDTWAPGFNMWVKHDPDALSALQPSGTVVNVTVPGVLTDLSQAAGTGVFSNFLSVAKWGLIAFIGYKAISLFKNK